MSDDQKAEKTKTEGATNSEEVSAEVRKAIKDAKGSSSKKVLWWVLAILGIVIVLVTVVLIFIPRDDKKNPVRAIIDDTKKQTDKADIEAKITIAKANGVAETKIEELKKTMEIEDVDERRKRLTDLL